MKEVTVDILMLAGAFFMVVASIGVVRMPDLFMRLSSTAKASTLGASLLLVAVAVHFQDYGISGRVVAIIAFIVLTAPVAAHMICRAAYFSNVPLWEGTILDELRGRYDFGRHLLKDPEDGDAHRESGGNNADE